MNNFKTSILITSLLIIISFSAFGQDRDKMIKAYITIYADEAVTEMWAYKIPASITLAQGLFESGFGKSRLATEANNHFGIKCHKVWTGPTIHHDDDAKNECFRKYSTAGESYRDHSLFLTSRDRYNGLFDLKLDDYKGWAKGLKKAGYATNPKYADRIIDIIEEFELYSFDTLTSLEPLHLMLEPEIDPIITRKDSATSSNIKIAHKDSGVVSNNNSEFVLVEDRQVKYRNRIKYVIIKKGETKQSIALEYDLLSARLVSKYNDLKPDQELKEGMIIYLQPKRSKCPDKVHVVKSGETLWSVSQLNGIKLQKLLAYNKMSSDDKIQAGSILKLRK